MKRIYNAPKIRRLEIWFPWRPTAAFLNGFTDMLILPPLYASYILNKWEHYQVEHLAEREN